MSKGERKDMCGLGVVIEELPHAAGYDLHIDNEFGDEEVNVDFDFSQSDNLALVCSEEKGISVHGHIASVSIPAGRTDLKVSLRQVDVKKNIELRLQTTPAEQCVPIVLECKACMKAKSLSGLRGYDILFDNPTEEDLTLEFDFSKSENLSVKAQGTTVVDGFTASVNVPAGAVDCPFVLLETKDPTQQIALEYSLVSFPTKDANPPATRDMLKCGAYLTLQPLPKAAGYEFFIDNPTKKTHKLTFDFTNSSNLSLCHPGTFVTIDGSIASVTLPADAEKVEALFALHSIDKTKGVAMSYVLHSEAVDA